WPTDWPRSRSSCARPSRARRRAAAARRAVTRRASKPKATVRHRPATRPTSRKAVQRQSPPKAQRSPTSSSQPRGLSEAQKRSIDEQLGRVRPTGSHTRATPREADGIADQGTGWGPASKAYQSDTPRHKKLTVVFRLWQIFRPPATPS
ncbi:hypothetical protein, partial [Nonomuraea sp. NPDC049504]|uniref:hypothetical protein n=1 Tax=Nonomuraea sp. NPDC049504 TaxID=3154729 RepID=UPI003416FC1B